MECLQWPSCGGRWRLGSPGARQCFLKSELQSYWLRYDRKIQHHHAIFFWQVFNFTETDHLVKLRHEPFGNTITITFQYLTKYITALLNSCCNFEETSPNFTAELPQIHGFRISSLATFRLIRRSFDFSVVVGCYGCALCLGNDEDGEFADIIFSTMFQPI